MGGNTLCSLRKHSESIPEWQGDNPWLWKYRRARGASECMTRININWPHCSLLSISYPLKWKCWQLNKEGVPVQLTRFRSAPRAPLGRRREELGKRQDSKWDSDQLLNYLFIIIFFQTKRIWSWPQSQIHVGALCDVLVTGGSTR